MGILAWPLIRLLAVKAGEEMYPHAFGSLLPAFLEPPTFIKKATILHTARRKEEQRIRTC